jgi:lysophospholipase L1-like esterase
MNRSRALVSLLALALPVLALPGAAGAAVNTGSADFTNYVSCGDSLTAGYTSASLIDVSQKRDYPSIIANQATGGTLDFEQPLISPPGIPGILHLVGLFPADIVPVAGEGAPENLTLPRPYNNLGIPGETVGTMLAIKSDTQIPPFTPGFHDIILRGLGTQLQEAVASQPTFVSLWIGNNDALGAATSGNVALLTPTATFQAGYNEIVGALAGTGAKMAIANIPDVTSIPFVTTLAPVVVDPTTNQVVLINGAPVPILEPNNPLALDDHVLLSASAYLAQGVGIPAALGGTGKPLPASVVLTAADAATIDAQVAQYNTIIQAAASQIGAAYVDVNSLLNQLATTGIEVGGVPFNADFLTGGVFSYDGVHPTSFGYAYVANAFIAAINAQFGADIPAANLAPAMFSEPAPVSIGATTESRPTAHQAVWTRYVLTTAAMANLEKVLATPEPAAKGGRRKH